MYFDSLCISFLEHSTWLTKTESHSQYTWPCVVKHLITFYSVEGLSEEVLFSESSLLWHLAHFKTLLSESSYSSLQIDRTSWAIIKDRKHIFNSSACEKLLAQQQGSLFISSNIKKGLVFIVLIFTLSLCFL